MPSNLPSSYQQQRYEASMPPPTIDIDMNSQTSKDSEDHHQRPKTPKTPKKERGFSLYCSYTWWAFLLLAVGLGFLASAIYMQVGVCSQYTFTNIQCNTTSWRETNVPYQGIVGYVTYTALAINCKFPERTVYTCSPGDISCLNQGQFNFHQPIPWPCYYRQRNTDLASMTCDPQEVPFLATETPDTNYMPGCQMRTGFFVIGGVITFFGVLSVLGTSMDWDNEKHLYPSY